MSVVFKRKIEEKTCEKDGRVIAECRVLLTLPYSEEDESGDTVEKRSPRQNSLPPIQLIRETLGSLFDAAVAGADGFFEKVSGKYDEEKGGGRFYAYRMTVDICASSEPFLSRERCFAPKREKKGVAPSKAGACKCSGECLCYVVSYSVSRRAKIIYRQKREIAFRLRDGYVCTLSGRGC